jgi:plastocyanin
MRALLAAALLAWLANPAHAADAKVTIDNFTFAPATLTVEKGTRVVFTNHDDIPHLVVSTTAPPFKSDPLDTDDSFAHVFDTPGIHRYFCSLHPHMQGTIIVK